MSPIGIRNLPFGTKLLLYDSVAFRNEFVKRISDRADILSRSCASALVFKDPASALPVDLAPTKVSYVDSDVC